MYTCLEVFAVPRGNLEEKLKAEQVSQDSKKIEPKALYGPNGMIILIGKKT